MTRTLYDIRAGAARLCDDWVKFVATQNSADTTVLIDEYAGYENDHHFRGSEAWIPLDTTTVANRGKSVRVLDSDRDVASLSFGPGLVSSPVLGDTAWLFNIGGEGTRIRTYDAYINDAIAGLGEAAAIPYMETVSIYANNESVFSQDLPNVAVPATMSHVNNIQYFIDTGHGSRAINIPSYGYNINQVNQVIYIDDEFAQVANGSLLRIQGMKPHPTLVNDSDTTDIDYEWLTLTVAGHVLINMSDQLKVNKGGMYMNAVVELRGKANGMLFQEGMVRVR